MGNLSKNFNREEFECSCGCGFNTVDYELVNVLEDVREKFGKPITINSGCRCDDYNRSIGGAYESKHKYGIAADIVVGDTDADVVYFYLEDKYKDKYGVGRYNGRTHIDVRREKARWDSRSR